MKSFALSTSACAALVMPDAPAHAQFDRTDIVVTATRLPEEAAQSPETISVVSGEELRARNVADLRGALALVVGVEAPPGGDAGPASAVPSFWVCMSLTPFYL